MSRWEAMAENRRWFGKMGVGLFGVAALSTLPTLWGQELTVPAAALLAVLGSQCFMAHQFLERMLDMQARIDMKRVARGEDPE